MFAIRWLVLLLVMGTTVLLLTSSASCFLASQTTMSSINSYTRRPSTAHLLMRRDVVSKNLFNYNNNNPSSFLRMTAMSSDAASPENDAENEANKNATNLDKNTESNVDKQETTNDTFLKKVKNYLSGPNDGLTTKQRLAKMGLAAALSYGWVSNMSYSVTVALAWYIFSKQTGKSPFAPGQWKGFLAVYAGFWVFNNFVRPVRVAVSIAISPQFDKVVKSIQRRLNISKAAAVTVTVLLANLVGTTLFMSAGIAIAAILAGVPVFPPKV